MHKLCSSRQAMPYGMHVTTMGIDNDDAPLYLQDEVYQGEVTTELYYDDDNDDVMAWFARHDLANANLY